MTLNKYMWIKVDDARMIYDGESLPADGKYVLTGKYYRQLILEPVSIGHRVDTELRDIETTGLVVCDQHGWLWQALHESDMYGETGFVDEIRGYVKFTRCVERTETRTVYEDVP